MNNIANMNYYFNKTYYDFLEECSLDNINIAKEVKKIIINNNNKIKKHKYGVNTHFNHKMNTNSFKGTILYPGAIIGSGNSHKVNAQGEICIGFTFDYVTGLPYLPGSSLKGILSQAFQYTDYIINNLKITGMKNKNEFLKELKENIFGSEKQTGVDVFLDSYVELTDKNQQILKLDNLAPHRQNEKLLEMGTVKILTMLRIAPGTKMKFNFILSDSHIVIGSNEYIIKVEHKLELFKMILSDFGIGAKTNVGYGRLEISQ